MRNRFDEQLALLNVELIKMGSLCELAISNSAKGLLEGRKEFLGIAIDTDKEIDEKEKEIENLCLKLLLQQQPVAKDLRIISSALKMISDMERIGDQASDIAEIAEYASMEGGMFNEKLGLMASNASDMVADAIKSFVDKNLDLAHKVMDFDDVIDEQFEKIRDEIVMLIREDAAPADYCLDMLMIGKYLERIGDHAVNIAEWVEFSITGIHMSEELKRK